METPTLEMQVIQRQQQRIVQLRGLLQSFLKEFGFTLVEEGNQLKVLRKDGSLADMNTLFR